MTFDSGKGSLRGRIEALLTQTYERIHQHGHAANSGEHGESQSQRESLGAQEENFSQRHECWNSRQHHRRQARRHAALGPKE
jgi:hypothetical protein